MKTQHLDLAQLITFNSSDTVPSRVRGLESASIPAGYCWGKRSANANELSGVFIIP